MAIPSARRVLATILLTTLLVVLSGCGIPGGNSANKQGPTAWNPQAWNNLDKLGPYSFQSTFRSYFPSDGNNVSFAFDGRYHNPNDYQVAVSPSAGALHAPTLTLRSAGGRFFLETPAGWLDLGTKVVSPMRAGVDFLRNAQNRWSRLLQTATDIHPVGSCRVAGLAGGAFSLKVAPFQSAPALTFAGSACLDATTGALLSFDAGGTLTNSRYATVTVTDRFRVAGVGNVPSILPPAQATPVPEL